MLIYNEKEKEKEQEKRKKKGNRRDENIKSRRRDFTSRRIFRREISPSTGAGLVSFS